MRPIVKFLLMMSGGIATNRLDTFFTANVPILRHKLEETSGNFLNSGSLGAAYDGVPGGTMSRGQSSGTTGAGNGIVTNGTDSVISIYPALALKQLGVLTVLAVIHPVTEGESFGGIIADKVNEFYLAMASSARLDFFVKFSGTNARAITSPNSIVLDTTFTVEARIDTDKVPHIFVNGVECTYGTQTTGVGTVTDVDTFYYEASQGGALTFNGGIYDIAIMNAALSDALLLQYYQCAML